MLSLRLKQSFPPIILIFIEGEGDGIKSTLYFKIFSTLTDRRKSGGRGLPPGFYPKPTVLTNQPF